MQAVIDWKPAPSEYRACLLMMLLFALEVKCFGSKVCFENWK